MAGAETGMLPILLVAATAYAASAIPLRASGATTFYVSPAGDDASTGTDPSSAWRSLARASHVTLGQGDALLRAISVTHGAYSPAKGHPTRRAALLPLPTRVWETRACYLLAQ